MNERTALFVAYSLEQRNIWDKARIGVNEQPILNDRYLELRKLKDQLMEDMTNEDHDLASSCIDPFHWQTTLAIRAHMNAKWKKIEESKLGIVHPPKAEFIPHHNLPDVREYSLKYGHLKHEAKEAKRREKIGKPDKQEIED